MSKRNKNKRRGTGKSLADHIFSNLDLFRQGLFTTGDLLAAVGKELEESDLTAMCAEFGTSPKDAPDVFVCKILAGLGLEVEIAGTLAGVVQYRINPLSLELMTLLTRGYCALLEGKPRPPVTTDDLERVGTLCMKLNKSRAEWLENLRCMGETEQECRDIFGLWNRMARGEDGSVELDPTLTLEDAQTTRQP